MSFVEDENRINVAFTRARKKLIVIGNANSINKNNQESLLYKFILYVQERKGYFNYFNLDAESSRLVNYHYLH